MSDTARLFDLNGKVALVTGATGRLGAEITTALAEMGADVIVVARTLPALHDLQSRVEAQTKRKITPFVADTTEEASVRALFEGIADETRRLDILVNNVTGSTAVAVENLSETTWNHVMQQTVTGMFLCCQAASRLMLPQESGSIINIASIYGVVAADQRIYGDSGFNSSVVYGTGKAAVIQMTRYLAALWGQTGIRVNAITPGGVEDAGNDHPTFRENYANRTPMGRMMQRHEIKGPLAFLASQASSYMTGHNLVVDGGFTIV